MSECIDRNCRLCDKLILSTAINFDSTANQVIVALPANCYGNCQKFCIVLAQSIPTTATINSQVVFTIGTNPTRYPFLNKDCTPIYASQIKTRRVYQTRVNTAINSGIFKYIGKCCLPSSAVTVTNSLPTTATTTVATPANVVIQNTNLKETNK